MSKSSWILTGGPPILAAAALVVGLSGCGSKSATSPTQEAGAAGPETCAIGEFEGDPTQVINIPGCTLKLEPGSDIAIFGSNGTLVSVTNVSQKAGSSATCAVLGDLVLAPGQSIAINEPIEMRDSYFTSGTPGTSPCYVWVQFTA